MPDQPAPAHRTGQHLLGPHVVGQRVVIRHLLPPGSGAGATDVLGECVAFGDVVVVRREDGEIVRIPVDSIVSGKPVPLRASVRQRVSARAAEDHTLRLWQGVEQQQIGEWMLRTEPHPPGRLRKRANSCLAIGDPGCSFEEAAARIEAFYRAKGRDILIQVEADSAVEQQVRDSGWQHVAGGDSEFLLTSLAHALRTRPPRLRDEITFTEDGDRARVEIPGVAVGEATFDRDWLGLHALDVAPEHRRRGVATAVLRELLEWGAELGGSTAWLHVEVDNQAALELYRGFGFRGHHGCRYYRLGSPATG